MLSKATVRHTLTMVIGQTGKNITIDYNAYYILNHCYNKNRSSYIALLDPHNFWSWMHAMLF